MLDHHVQRSIVYRLAFTPGLRFSELKPNTLDNKLFDYHLKKVIHAGLVIKDEEGLYTLTSKGRRMGVHISESQQAFVDRADSVLFLVIRRKSDGAWLLYKRLTHPLLNKIGFMHANPNATENCTVTASEVCNAKTGLKAEFKVLGGGYFRVYDKDQLESFTHFTLLVCEDAKGELAQADEYAEYAWHQEPDFSGADMLPNMQILGDLYQKGELFFVEHTLQT